MNRREFMAASAAACCVGVAEQGERTSFCIVQEKDGSRWAREVGAFPGRSSPGGTVAVDWLACEGHLVDALQKLGYRYGEPVQFELRPR